jgi:hypothetical protein
MAVPYALRFPLSAFPIPAFPPALPRPRRRTHEWGGQVGVLTIDTDSVWLYPENRKYRINIASPAISECYTTHMGAVPGPHRSLTAPTP